MSLDLETFGLQSLLTSFAKDLYRKEINVFIKIHYFHTDMNQLKETELLLLNKIFLEFDYDTNFLFQNLKETNYKSKNIALRKKAFLKDRAFKNAVNQVVTKYIFPYPIMDIFYYTDNKKEIPVKYKLDESKYKQSTIDF